MLNRAPATPQRRPAFTDNAGLLSDYGVQVLTEIRKQIAPGFPVVPVSIAGTNALTLTPTLDVEGGQTYGNGMVWRGIPPKTSTGALTAGVATLAKLKVYKGDGSTQAGSGDIVKNQLYDFVYESALNSGAGGFFLIQPLNQLLSLFAAVTPATGFLTLTSTTVGVGGKLVLQTFAASGTYTPTTGMLYVLLGAVGGGGGGGGAANSGAGNADSGGGGGGGSTSLALKSAAQIGASQVVTIGAVANGGAAGNNNGTAGNDTSIGALCVGKGGSPGGGAASGGQGASGTGGIAGTGDITIAGQAGGVGQNSAITTNRPVSGIGGNSGLGFGAGGRAAIAVGDTTGINGSNYGGGGSGGISTAAGGAAAGGNSAPGFAFALELVAA